jgi:threonine dehydratase
VGETWDEANRAALDFASQTGAAYFHPFADPLVVAGQGTLGLDIVDDLPHIDTLLVAIGGGGLIAGVATAVRARRPDIRVIGIEPTGSPTLKASLDAGQRVRLPAITTKVPTMACRETDERIFRIVRETVPHIILVTDEAMEEALVRNRHRGRSLGCSLHRRPSLRRSCARGEQTHLRLDLRSGSRRNRLRRSCSAEAVADRLACGQQRM